MDLKRVNLHPYVDYKISNILNYSRNNGINC